MAYQIQRTEKADEQIRDIILYRAELKGDIKAGLELLDQMESEIMSLGDFPEMGPKPRYSALRKRGFRVLIIDRYLVFYKVDHSKQLVIVHAVVDGRREYLNLI